MQRKYVRSLLTRLAFLVSVSFFAVFDLGAQGPATVSLTATQSVPFPAGTLSYGNGKTLGLRWDFYADHVDFEPVAIYPDQVLQINLQFPPAAAGRTIFVGAENGGVVATPANSGAVIIGTDGTVSIGFQAPHDPGKCPVRFRFGAYDSVLPFWVMNSDQVARPLRSQRAD